MVSCCPEICLTLVPLNTHASEPIPFFFSSTVFPGLLKGVSLCLNSICPLRESENLQTEICHLIICSFEYFLLIRHFQRKCMTLSVNASGGMGSYWFFVLRHFLSQQLWTMLSHSSEMETSSPVSSAENGGEIARV